MPTPATERYVPAAGRRWLTALYDPVMALTMRERVFRAALIAAVSADPPPRIVLDLGCGTGTLAVELVETNPSIQLLGIDGDEKVLACAREKSVPLGAQIRFERGFADALPYPDASFDVVIASLLLHHLAPASKLRTLREARRVLALPGRLVIADWGPAHDPFTRASFFALQLLDGFQNTRDHADGRLPVLVADAGFASVRVTQRWRTLWGSLELITAEAA